MNIFGHIQHNKSIMIKKYFLEVHLTLKKITNFLPATGRVAYNTNKNELTFAT